MLGPSTLSIRSSAWPSALETEMTQAPADPSVELLVLINLIIALMIYGVALDLRATDFLRLRQRPTALIAGLGAQFVLLPALTALATWWWAVPAELALALLLVASCPGGNLSNVLTGLARGNIALSVSMTAVSTLCAVVMTPINFALYSGLNPATRELALAVGIDFGPLLGTMLLVLGLPLLLGMLTRSWRPGLAQRLQPPLRAASVLMLLLLVGGAFYAHRETLLLQGGEIALLAVLHNTAALVLGAAVAVLARLQPADRRAVTFEVGLQNTGLALVILVTLYPGQTQMIVLAALWGLPHLASGLGLVAWWNRTPAGHRSRLKSGVAR